MRCGIEKMNVYTGSLVLDLADLALSREKDVHYFKNDLLLDKKSHNTDYEDVITMAVNAALPIITDRDREDIELCIFATESGLDYCKSNSSYVCKYLHLKPQVRNYEIKNACYATTCAVQTALQWIRSGAAPGKKALIVSSDISYNTAGREGEEIPGIGAVAILVSNNPVILEFEHGKNGYYSFECTDYARPTSTFDIINGQESLYAYVECLEGAWEHYKSRIGDIDFNSYFKRLVYHTPFAGLVKLGHGRLLKDMYPGIRKKEIAGNFAERVLPSLEIAQQIGNAYSSAVYICLLSLLLYDRGISPGDRIGIYSYGSGSCAEFYSALVGEKAIHSVQSLGIQEHLDQRQPIDVPVFDMLSEIRTGHADQATYKTVKDIPRGWYDQHYRGKGLLVLNQVKDYIREYDWS
jgi:hydroxymethylglutaryl-CoA synthase